MTDLMETDDMVTTILKEKGGKKLSGMSVLCPERPLDQVNDLGNLLGFEANELSENPDEDFIKSRTRDNLQVSCLFYALKFGFLLGSNSL
ncbi:Ribosome biogenesis regulatory protein [Caligus rogercresseyi]|uniref:Ribosome biogenesis regulatory protein n=1 Tax=Caligus rogercresseyi TaxID=217165 RepID=A0A7T8GYC1_CALRO|nr:Ribosome biogenesis regulatory protein [Caligus rogercresseyi]